MESTEKSLFQAAVNGNVVDAEKAVAAGANVNACADTDSGWASLHYAARHGHTALIGWLVEKGADINLANHHGRTPLHVAAHDGHADVVRLLIDLGASSEIRDQSGRLPIDVATDNVRSLLGATQPPSANRASKLQRTQEDPNKPFSR